MAGHVKTLAIAGALLLAACGSSQRPDLEINGTGVVIRSRADFARAPDLAARMETTISAALGYWGGSWEQLRGMTITLEEAQYVACGDSSTSIGCYDGDIRVSTRDPAFTFSCVEQTALVHEIGHAVIGDADHTDPRWMDFAPVAQELEGRTGYSQAGPVDCQIYVSVWRHLPSGG